MADRWEDYFAPGEKLLWEGAPFADKRITLMIVLVALIGAVFASAGAMLMFDALRDIAALHLFPGLAVLPFGAVLLLAGLAMIAGHWVQRAYADKYVRYALSDQNGYVATRWTGRDLEVIPILPGEDVVLVDGVSVMFRTVITRDSEGRRSTSRRGFDNIREADHVFGLIRKVQAEKAANHDG